MGSNGKETGEKIRALEAKIPQLQEDKIYCLNHDIQLIKKFVKNKKELSFRQVTYLNMLKKVMVVIDENRGMIELNTQTDSDSQSELLLSLMEKEPHLTKMSLSYANTVDQTTVEIKAMQQGLSPLVLNLYHLMEDSKALITPETRRQVIESHYKLEISKYQRELESLYVEIQSSRQKTAQLWTTIQQEKTLLSEQYRTGAFIMGVLALSGIGAGIIVSYMLSNVALFAVASIVSVCAARQAYYFFNESKQYRVDPDFTETESMPLLP